MLKVAVLDAKSIDIYVGANSTMVQWFFCEITRNKGKEIKIDNLQMLNHVLRLWELNCGGADMFCQN